MTVDVRKGMPPRKLDRAAFETRLRSRFVDPVFRPLERELAAIVAAAWDAYAEGRKAPLTRAAAPGFADPSYEIAVDWLAGLRGAIIAAQARCNSIVRGARGAACGQARHGGTEIAGAAAEVIVIGRKKMPTPKGPGKFTTLCLSPVPRR